jgi:hypothetical protein
MMRLFQKIDCLETIHGILLTWKLREGVYPKEFAVFGTNRNRTWEIKAPIIDTCRCLISTANDGLASQYKVRVKTMSGDCEESDPRAPQALDKASRILLKEIKRRENVVYRAHPFGAYDAHILLKKQVGKPCPVCGTGKCGGAGGASVDPSCSVCLGTGINKPYYVYPRAERILGVPPKDDKVTGTPGAQRLVVEQSFRTVFPGVIREDDALVIGNEVYVVLEATVPASVGNTPATYQLTCSQLMPDDPKYTAIIEHIRGVIDGK